MKKIILLALFPILFVVKGLASERNPNDDCINDRLEFVEYGQTYWSDEPFGRDDNNICRYKKGEKDMRDVTPDTLVWFFKD